MASGYLLKFQEFLLLCTSGHFHWKSHIALITREMTMEDQVGSLSISRCSSTSSTCEAFPASSKASMHCKVQMSIYLDLPDFSIPRYVLDMFSATFSVSKAPTGICLRACRPSWAPTSQRNDTVGHRSRRPPTR